MSKIKSKLWVFIKEIIPVAIGVFLGFIVSNWTENSKKNSQTAQLKNHISAELSNNKSKIESVLEYHIMLRDSSRYYSNLNENSKFPSFFEGINTALLSSSAFDTGIQTGLINGLSMDFIQEANNVYNIQQSYKELRQLLTSGLFTMNFQGNDNDKNRFFVLLAMSMTDIVIHEEVLIEKYGMLMEKLKKD